jgi:hypothetical protein
MNLKTLLSHLLFATCAVCFLSIDNLGQETKPTAEPRATFQSQRYAYQLFDHDFADTPSWKQDESEPPLSVGRAIKIARENLPRFVKGAESWKVDMVTLKDVMIDKWYYRIDFLCRGVECREARERHFMAIVKMDGTILEPKKVIIED